MFTFIFFLFLVWSHPSLSMKLERVSGIQRVSSIEDLLPEGKFEEEQFEDSFNLWYSHSDEASPQKTSAHSESIDEELRYEGPPLSFAQAVEKRFNGRIKELLLKGGISLIETDTFGMSVFHRLAQAKYDHPAEKEALFLTWEVLFLTPRKNVFDAVSKMNIQSREIVPLSPEDAVAGHSLIVPGKEHGISPQQNELYNRMVHWHIIGLVRALLKKDMYGRIPDHYAKRSNDPEWRILFYPDEKHFSDNNHAIIKYKYIMQFAKNSELDPSLVEED